MCECAISEQRQTTSATPSALLRKTTCTRRVGEKRACSDDSSRRHLSVLRISCCLREWTLESYARHSEWICLGGRVSMNDDGNENITFSEWTNSISALFSIARERERAELKMASSDSSSDKRNSAASAFAADKAMPQWKIDLIMKKKKMLNDICEDRRGIAAVCSASSGKWTMQVYRDICVRIMLRWRSGRLLTKHRFMRTLFRWG